MSAGRREDARAAHSKRSNGASIIGVACHAFEENSGLRDRCQINIECGAILRGADPRH
jgi:hypothetical protein